MEKMKIIYRINTDDGDKINRFKEIIEKEEVILPQGEELKIWVIDNLGNVVELK